jgi:hypothetical protein
MKKGIAQKNKSVLADREAELLKSANDMFSAVHSFSYSIRNMEQPDRIKICEKFGVPKVKFDQMLRSMRPLFIAQILDSDAVIIERVCNQLEISEAILAKNIALLRKTNPKVKIHFEKERGMYCTYGKNPKLKVI